MYTRSMYTQQICLEELQRRINVVVDSLVILVVPRTQAKHLANGLVLGNLKMNVSGLYASYKVL